MSQRVFSPNYVYLRDKWVLKHQQLQKNLMEQHKEAAEWIRHHTKNALADSHAGLVPLSQTDRREVFAQAAELELASASLVEYQRYERERFARLLAEHLPETVRPLTPEQESRIGVLLSETFSIPVSASVEGNRLERSYGYIRAQQHLARFPGDTLEKHFATHADDYRFGSSGMASHPGAWGYFAPSKEALTQKDTAREQYYIAVQTFLAPGWPERANELYAFFKYRKMLVVNPDNGKAVVAVVADVGPPQFTGKHVGGSPEIMYYLERFDDDQKGSVVYMFINDPVDRIPLGPIIP